MSVSRLQRSIRRGTVDAAGVASSGAQLAERQNSVCLERLSLRRLPSGTLRFQLPERLRRFTPNVLPRTIEISCFWLGSEREIPFDISRNFGVDFAKFFSCHLVSMPEDSSRPALSAVSLCREVAAQSSRGSSPQAWHGCVPGSIGVTHQWPTALSSDLGSLGFGSERTRRAVLRRNTDREKIPFQHPRENSSLHSGRRVEALAEE
jgi:hypothetical protein